METRREALKFVYSMCSNKKYSCYAPACHAIPVVVTFIDVKSRYWKEDSLSALKCLLHLYEHFVSDHF
jgi:hypothetical protein